MKKQNGITLIALIITIIVLLILAVVAIGAVQDSDIIRHAESATIEHKKGVKTEEERLGEYVEKIESQIPQSKTIETVIAKLNKDVTDNPTKYTDAGGERLTATDGTNLWTSPYAFEDRPHIFWEVIYDEIISKECEISSNYTATKTFNIAGNNYDITYLVIESLSAEPADPNDANSSKYIVTLPVLYNKETKNIIFDIEIIDGEDYKASNFRLVK